MKKFSPFILALTLIPLFSFLVLAYVDQSTRRAVISFLAKKDTEELQLHPTPGASSMLASVDSLFTTYPTAATATVNIVTASSASPISISTPVALNTSTNKTYEYSLLRGVSTCTLNKFALQGWQPLQFGGTIADNPGFDDNCPNRKIYDLIDWVLLSREVAQPVTANTR